MSNEEKVVIEIFRDPDKTKMVKMSIEMGDSFNPDNPNPMQIAAMVMVNKLYDWINNEQQES